MEEGPVLILVDTSSFIEFMNETGSKHHLFLKELIQGGGGDLCFSDIVLTEILQGIKEERIFKETRDSLLGFQIVSLIGIASYIKAAEIYRSCRKTGLTIRRGSDCLIAQAAIENDLELLHNDRDFETIARVTKLRQFNPGGTL